MAGKLELLQQALAGLHSPDDTPRIRQELDRALVGHHDLLVRIDDTNDLLWFQAGHAQIPSDKRTALSWEAEGTPYRSMTAMTASGYRITVGIDIGHHQQFLHAFERDLVARSSAQQLGDRLTISDMPVELQELATAFNDMLDRIGESLTRLSEFSSDLAHELRTPINNLMTQTQVSLSKPRNTEEYKETLYANLEEYERLARMIADMLFLAKADHGLIIPKRETVDVGKEIHALCDFYEVLADEKSIRLDVKGQAECSGDALMLRRAFGNLLANAIQHADPHTSIAIIIERCPGTIKISITNQGNTIPPEHLPRLFDRFYRADEARTRIDDGVGLGLAITQSIIKAHGGVITATSERAITRFLVEIPVKMTP